MQWCHIGKRGIAKIEIASFNIVLQIGIKAKKTSKPHHKDHVEVGKTTVASIQPQDTVFNIPIQQFVLLLASCDMVQEFSYKESHRNLNRIKRYRRERYQHPHVAQMLQIGTLPIVEFYIHYRQGLEILLLDLCLRCLGNTHGERLSTIRLGKHIHNHRRLTILQRVQHDSPTFSQHTSSISSAKVRKSLSIRKIS